MAWNQEADKLQDEWLKGVPLKVRYIGTDMEWVDVPDKNDVGLSGKKFLDWNTEIYEYSTATK
jgi:hypothetical protein